MTPRRPAFRPPTPTERAPSASRDRGRGPGLPSVNTGALRTRWTRYTTSPVDPSPIPVNINCWRATIYFADVQVQKPKWDGIDIGGLFSGTGFGEPVVVQIGGAYFNNRPVYLNETHYIGNTKVSILVVEEFFDPAVKPNN